jgi:hypothetical protein
MSVDSRERRLPYMTASALLKEYLHKAPNLRPCLPALNHSGALKFLGLDFARAPRILGAVQMTIVEEQVFDHTTVELDGKAFRHCRLVHSTLIYRGGDPPGFAGCEVSHCTFKFEDSAIRTLAFLNVMYNRGFHEIVEDFVKSIKKPLLPPQA